MQSENFDKKITEALEQRSPAYDEKGWEKMKPLLDRHLPEKKDERRRLLFLLFFFMFLGGGALLLINNPTGKSNIAESGTVSSPGNINSGKAGSLAEKTSPGNTQEPAGQKQVISEKKSLTAGIDEKVFSSGLQKKTGDRKKNNAGTTRPLEQTEEVMIETGNASVAKTNNSEIKTTTQNSTTSTAPPDNKSGGAAVIIKTTEEKTIPPDNAGSKPAENTTVKSAQSNPAVKKQNSFLKNIGFTLTAGPDISAVGLDRVGKSRFTYGAGLSYRVSERFNIRSGFYIAKKIYTAGPEDYKAPASFWAYYPNMKQIDANCNIYEVPVNLDFYFGSNKKQRWFASAGTSALFMKKEKYDYIFKPPYSPGYISYSHTYENKNKHFLSSVNLSGGYSRTITPHLSILAEPFVKIPVSGIGQGKIKLSSGGILISAFIKPFAGAKNNR